LSSWCSLLLLLFVRSSLFHRLFFLIFFFFQAEDGIRDFHVTGVQTCALPIWPTCCRAISPARATASGAPSISSRPCAARFTSARSEERRVGKECRSRWSP